MSLSLLIAFAGTTFIVLAPLCLPKPRNQSVPLD